MSPLRIAVLGTGAVARAILAAHTAAGGVVEAVISRERSRAIEVARRFGGCRGSSDLTDLVSADVGIAAVPDRELGALAIRLAAIGAPAESLVLHTSGALCGDVLGGAGIRAGSLHPLQSFPAGASDEQLAARIKATHWFHEGEGWNEASALVACLRGTPHRLAAGSKSLYHAGAAVLSNHTVALYDTALELFAAAGVPRDEAHAPLASLLGGTAANVAALGVPAALTGPIARGDAGTVAAHLEALRRATPGLLPSYVAMARRALVVARAKSSISAEDARRIDALLWSADGSRQDTDP